MSPAFAAEVKQLQNLKPEALAVYVGYLETALADYQSKLAAARKAQKNQKRAAKDRKKVVG